MAQGLTQVNDENVRRRPVESSGEHREHMQKVLVARFAWSLSGDSIWRWAGPEWI